MVIGGPDILKPTDVADVLSRVLGREITFRQSTSLEFAHLINGIFSSVLDLPRDVHVQLIADFYDYNNAAKHSPMAVDMDPMLALLPIELTNLETWAAGQTWTLRQPGEKAPIGG